MPEKFKHKHIVATIDDSLISNIKDELFENRLPQWEGSEGLINTRKAFIRIAAHSSNVKGIDWQPPSMHATEDELKTSIETFLTVVDEAALNAWIKALTALFGSTAPVAEQGTGEENPTTAQQG